MKPEYRQMVVQVIENQAYRALAGCGLRLDREKWPRFMGERMKDFLRDVPPGLPWASQNTRPA